MYWFLLIFTAVCLGVLLFRTYRKRKKFLVNKPQEKSIYFRCLDYRVGQVVTYTPKDFLEIFESLLVAEGIEPLSDNSKELSTLQLTFTVEMPSFPLPSFPGLCCSCFFITKEGEYYNWDLTISSRKNAQVRIGQLFQEIKKVL